MSDSDSVKEILDQLFEIADKCDDGFIQTSQMEDGSRAITLFLRVKKEPADLGLVGQQAQEKGVLQ